MKCLNLLAESVAATWTDMKPIFIGFIALVLVAVVVDRALFIQNNVERVIDAQYGVVQWPGSHSLIRVVYTRDYDGRGTKKVLVLDVRWPLLNATQWFARPDGTAKVCKPGILGRNCKPLMQLPAIAQDIIQSGENRLAILTN